MDDAVRDQEAFEIEFEPVGRRGRALPGETLLSVAQSAGVELVAVCGGAGVCGTCRVRWLSGDFTPPGMDEEGVLEDGEIEEGWRLACRASVVSSAVVEIPPESMATVQRLQLEGRVVADGLDPSVEVVAVQVDPPSGKDLRSDWSRLAAALQSAGMPVGRCRLSVARSCSTRVRTNGWHARVVVDTVAEPAEVVAILGGDERAMGLAVDIGTTKIAAYLVDLESGDTVARSGVMNPQIAYGEDVVSRIAYANQGSEQASTLQTRLADAVQSLAADLCDTAGVTPSEIVDCVIVENTAIHHLLTGLSVRQLGEAPYVPVVSSAMSVTAVEVGLSLAPGAHIYLPPNVAGYVGADHVSMLLATDLESIVGVVLAIDIGTNTEISLRVDDRILTCSCASGPAFEGAHIRDGMRAVPGAVERVHAAGDTIHIHTVGDQPPVGICGSGILDAVAIMLDNGIINDRGGLRVDHPGVKIVGTERQFVLVRAERTGHGSDVVVTRSDVHEIQLAKGAIRAGIEVLLHEASLTSAAIDSFVVAGAFGTYLDVESAKRIGMFPDVPKERFHQVGNAAGMGAIQMLRSRTARRSVESLVRGIEYIELTTHPHFSDLFTQALFFHSPDSLPEASDTDTRENASPRRAQQGSNHSNGKGNMGWSINESHYNWGVIMESDKSDSAVEAATRMTGRERMLTAFARKEADHVPVSPDLSAMVPVRLSGKPFDEMFLDGRSHNGYASASVAEAYVDAVRYFGMDGWYIYGSLPEIIPDDRPRWVRRLEPRPGGGQVEYEEADTPYGPLTQKTIYFTDEPPWEEVKPVKDLKRDWPRLKALMGEDEDWKWDPVFLDRDRIGELGVYSMSIGIPQDWWFFQRDGGYNTLFFDYVDEAAYVQEIMEYYSRYAIARLEAALEATPQPDEVMLGGSASSLSVSSPSNFRKYDLPFVKEAARICRRAGVFSHLHVCGKADKIAEMVAEETDVDVIEPLEEPPGGNINIAEYKRKYGDRICLKGNLNTFDFMLNATPQQVEDRCKRLIDDCAAGGGFVLSTGDQCGRDTPDANLFKMVKVAKTYGRYR